MDRWTTLTRASLLASLTLNLACAPGDSRPTSPDLSRGIDAVFRDMDRLDVPGASVAVVRDGSIVFSKGYGSAQLEHRVPITPRTVFHVASVSKQFTAMAVTMLAAEGELDLDDRVQTHLPWVPGLGRPVTVRQMIHHTSGIRDQWELLAMAGWRLDDVITMDHIREMMGRQRGLNFEPNSEYLYSNMGYTLLAETAAAVGGAPFADLTEEMIFEPLGMTRTHFHDDHQMVVPDRAYSYAPLDDGGFRKAVLSYANAGATSLFTTAEDLARWLDNFRHHRVGGPDVTAQMLARGVLQDGDTIDYAHGLSIGEYRGLETVGHGGADAGFRTSVQWFPEHDVGIVVLTNVANGDPSGRLFAVADVVLANVFPESPDADDADDADGENRPTSRIALDRAPGRYRTTLGPVIAVERDGDDLALRVPNAAAARLRALSDSEFDAPDLDVRVRFAPTWDSFLVLDTGGNEVGSGERIPDDGLPVALGGYAGTYYSSELDALYTLRVEDDTLIAHHVRHGDIPLELLLDDEFVSDRWFLGTVRFRRGGGGDVEGFDVTGGRVRNLRFVRLPGALPV